MPSVPLHQVLSPAEADALAALSPPPGPETLDACGLTPATAAGLAPLLAPAIWARIEARAGDLGLRALFAVSGSLGASISARADHGVDLSFFPALALGEELARAVPTPEELTDTAHPIEGRLPLEPLPAAGVATEVTFGQHVDETLATLSCLVGGTDAAGASVLVGHVTWLALGHGWLGLERNPDDDSYRMTAPDPASRADVGPWSAAPIGQILGIS